MSDGTPSGRRPADWHVDPATAAAYARGSVREPDAWSVEKHVESCSRCAATVSAAVRAVPAAATALAEVRSALLTRITSPDESAAARRPGPEAVPHPAGTTGGSPPARPTAGTGPSGPAAGSRPEAPGVPAPGHAAAARTTAAPPATTDRPPGTGAGARPRLSAVRQPGAETRRPGPKAGPHPAGTTGRSAVAGPPATADRRTGAHPGAARAGALPGVPGVRSPGAARDPGVTAHRPGADGGPTVRRAVGGRRGGRWRRLSARGVGPAVGKGWLGALLAVIATAFTLSYVTGFDAARPLLLVLAPVLPPAGVALSYGRYTDPLHEIAAATPSGGLRLLLTRTAFVLAVSVTLLTTTGALLPADGGAPGAAAWLLPGLALTLGSLVLGSWTGLPVAAAVLAGGWLAAVLLPVAGTAARPLDDRLAPLVGAAAQGGWAAAAVLCAGLLVLRRSSFDHLERV